MIVSDNLGQRKSLVWVVLVSLGLGALYATLRSDWFWDAARPVVHKDLINRSAAETKIDPLLIMALVREESSFRKRARSPRGAIGLMQIMPDTAREMAARLNMPHLTEADFEKPEINLMLGSHYLALLREEFGDNMVAVLAAYNAGPAKARSWNVQHPLMLDDIRFPETRAFVENVLNTYGRLKQLQKVKNVFHLR